MKIAQLLTNSSVELENRKRAIQRKEMGAAYKKTAQYQAPKNPMLEVLGNLLSGKADKALHAEDKAQSELASNETISAAFLNEQLEVAQDHKEQLHARADDRILQRIEQEAIMQGLADVAASSIAVNSANSTSPNDLVESATMLLEQMELAQGEYEHLTNDEINPFAEVDTNIDVPNRFLADFDQRDATEQTVFGQDLENLIFQRTFQKATSLYTNHIAMVKNGYRSMTEPIFSQIA